VGIGAVRAALMAAAAVAFFYALPAASGQPRAYGRELVAQYQLPAEAVARYAAQATTPAPAEKASDRTAWTDNAMWVGPLQQVGVGRNPYTLVLTVGGVARAAGDIGAHWQAGWEVRESPLATREVLMSVGAQQTGGTTAGAPVTLTAISAPLSFRGERQVAPLLNLVNANNLDISDVHLQVWSGSAPLLIWPSLSTPRPALVGLGALCLLMWFFLRRTARPPVAAVSRLPPAELQAMPEQPSKADRSNEPPPPAPPQPAAPAAPVIASPTPNHASRVVSALRDVLFQGLVVPAELDTTRRRRSTG
jgi:hypothetical protein